MKTMRLISIIILGLLITALVLGNIFYVQVRSWVDPDYIAAAFSENDLSRLNYNRNPDYSFVIQPDRSGYARFERIKIMARLQKRSDGSIPESAAVLCELFLNGEKLRDVSGNETIKLVYDNANKVWTGYWYPASETIEGTVLVLGRAFPDKPEATLEARAGFLIYNREPLFPMRKAQAYLGIESQDKISKRSLLSVDGREVDWNYIPEWLDFINVDGILMMGGITKTFDDITLESPWDNAQVSEAFTLADKCRQRGKKFGVWVRALRVEGVYAKTNYQVVQSFKDGRARDEITWISQKDENRKRSIIKLLSSYMQNDGVSFVGLSDLFYPTDFGTELFERFIGEFRVDVPGNWKDMSVNDKNSYFLSRMQNPDFARGFNVWKKYMASEYIRDIVEKVGHRKPFFYFTDHRTVLSNPEIVSIALSSGIDFIVIDFSVNYSSLQDNLKELADIQQIARVFNRVIISYSIDYSNVDINGFEQSAIENFVSANIGLVRSGSDYLNAGGIMINDLYRAMFGKRGPYSPYEWILGIGESVYRFKNINRTMAAEIEVYVPGGQVYSKPFQARVRVKNTGAVPITDFKLEFLPVSGLKTEKNQNITFNTIPAGSSVSSQAELSFQLLTTSQLVRKKNFIGMRASWKEGSVSRGYVLFEPVAVKSPGSTTNTGGGQ